ncbi:MAG: hypothetical protein ACOZNI_28315 [Myxococcota bacterium]
MVVLLAARVALDLATLDASPARYVDDEDGYNAAVAWFVAHGGGWEHLLALQYRSFCGGCTTLAIAAAPVLSVFGDTLLAWKAVALAWTAAIGLAGFVSLDRHAGRFAGFAFLVAWAAAPSGLTDVSLMSWGNHAEVGLFVLVALALFDRPFWCGLACGAGLWFARTGAWGAVPIAVASLAKHRDWRLLAGLAIGAAPILIPAAPGDVGGLPARARGRIDLPHVLLRLRMLYDPAALGVRLFPGSAHATAASAAVLGAAAIGELALLARRRWLLASFLPAFTAAYAAMGYATLSDGGSTSVLALRYHAPFFQILPLITAAGAGAIAARSRLAAVVLVAVPVIAVAAARDLPRRGDAPGAAAYRGSAPSYFGDIAQARLGPDAVEDVTSDDPAVLAVVGRIRGARLGAGVADVAGFREALREAGEGPAPVATRTSVGFSLAGCGVGREELAGWLAEADPDEARDVARGAALAYGRLARPKGRDERAAIDLAAMVEALRVGDDCVFCGGAGAQLLPACRQKGAGAAAACIDLATRATGVREDIVYTAGVMSVHRAHDPRQGERLEVALEARDPALAEAFAAGRRDPLAGVEHPGVPPDRCARGPKRPGPR